MRRSLLFAQNVDRLNRIFRQHHTDISTTTTTTTTGVRITTLLQLTNQCFRIALTAQTFGRDITIWTFLTWPWRPWDLALTFQK